MKLFSYLKKIISWIILGKFHIATILVVIVTILYLIGELNYYPMYISSIFTITGITIILFQQLLDAKQFSDYKPNTFKNWISLFPSAKQNIVNSSANLTASLSATAHLSVSVSENASLERKVEHLLKEMDSLNKQVYTINDNLKKTNNTISTNKNELTDKIEKVDKVIKSLIAGHIVGSYDINFFGIMITLCGTIIQIFS